MDKILFLKIEGMTCKNCVKHIKEELEELEGVSNIKIDLRQEKGEITYNNSKIEINHIIANIEKGGYKAEVSVEGIKDESEVQQLLGIVIVILAIFMTIKHTVGFNFIPKIDQSMGYGILFIIGIMTSIHCIAMCGGINLSQTANCYSKKGSFIVMMQYNIGRVLTYTIIGGVAGFAGSVFNISQSTKGIAAIVAGVVMVFIGLNMLKFLPKMIKIEFNLPLPIKLIKSFSKKGPFFIGVLNGLMPCGPLQTMQVYALGTGSFMAGAMSLLVFGLGTVPLMAGFGLMASLLSIKFTKNIFRVSAVLVIILGVMMVNRGALLNGISLKPSAKVIETTVQATSSKNLAEIDKEIQTITTKIEGYEYPEITVKKGFSVKWNFSVGDGELNGCNRAIIIPKYGIEKELKIGDNLIEFTPIEAGEFEYSCWMGMIKGRINVVN